MTICEGHNPETVRKYLEAHNLKQTPFGITLSEEAAAGVNFTELVYEIGRAHV